MQVLTRVSNYFHGLFDINNWSFTNIKPGGNPTLILLKFTAALKAKERPLKDFQWVYKPHRFVHQIQMN